MRKILILFFLIIAFGCSKESIQISDNYGWKTLNTSYLGNCVYFLNADTGFIVGGPKSIMKTTDGGKTWWPKVPADEHRLNSICFTDVNTGYAVGQNGEILITIDGGGYWYTRVSGTKCPLYSICFTDKNNGFATGYECSEYECGSVILQTTDGGSHWTCQGFLNFVMRKVCFISPGKGFIVGAEIFKTTNGGLEWTKYFEQDSLFLMDICFPDSTIGYTAGLYGRFLKTINGGESWTNMNLDPHYNLSSICFTSRDTGYIVGLNYLEFDNGPTGLILKTTDGGVTWKKQNSEIRQSVHSVFFVDAMTGYATGDKSVIKTTTGGED